MSRDERLYLRDILEACDRIQRLSAGRSRESLLSDEAAWYAVLYSPLSIGEAAKHLADQTRRDHPEVPWKRIAGFRDIAAHEYLGVDADLVMDIVHTEIPELKSRVARLLGP